MSYDISNRYMTARQKQIAKRLDMLIQAAPKLAQVKLFSGDYQELLKLKDRDIIDKDLYYKGVKLISSAS